MNFIRFTNTFDKDVYVHAEDIKAASATGGTGSWTEIFLYGPVDHRVFVTQTPAEVIEAVTVALHPRRMVTGTRPA